MEGTGSSSRLKKKAALGNSSMDVDAKKSTLENTDPRINSLVISNNALSHALDVAQKTIHHQDKLISNLQQKLVSHLPKLIELRLDAMGKVIQQLHSMFDETKALLNSGLPDSCPTTLSSDVKLMNDEGSDKEISIVDDFIAELEAPSPLVQNSSQRATSSSTRTSTTTTKMPSSSMKTPLSSKKNSSSSVKTTSNSKSSSRIKITVVQDTDSEKSPTIDLKKESPVKVEDELMSLPASTSKITPKMSRKRTSAPKVARKEVPSKRAKSERCKKVKKEEKKHPSSDEDEGDDDEEPVESKSQPLKIKLRPFMKIIENKKSKYGSFSNSINKDKRNAPKAVHDISSSSESSDEDKTSKNSSLPSSTKKSETVLASSNITSEESDSSKKPSTSNNKSKSNLPKSKKKESSRKSKTKSVNEKVKNADAPSAKPKVNGTVSAKVRRSKSSSRVSLINNIVNGTMVNGGVAKSASSKSFHGSTEGISIALIKDHQPQVILMDIFSNVDGNVNPLLAKKKEELRMSSKLGRRVEDSPAIEKSKSPLSASDKNSALEHTEKSSSPDLEVDGIFKEDTVISSNNGKAASPTPNQTGINSMLGLSSNVGASSDFGFFQNAKDKDSSSDKSFDNEINLDTIDRLLANCM